MIVCPLSPVIVVAKGSEKRQSHFPAAVVPRRLSSASVQSSFCKLPWSCRQQIRSPLGLFALQCCCRRRAPLRLHPRLTSIASVHIRPARAAIEIATPVTSRASVHAVGRPPLQLPLVLLHGKTRMPSWCLSLMLSNRLLYIHEGTGWLMARKPWVVGVAPRFVILLVAKSKPSQLGS